MIATYSYLLDYSFVNFKQKHRNGKVPKVLASISTEARLDADSRKILLWVLQILLLLLVQLLQEVGLAARIPVRKKKKKIIQIHFT